MSRYKLIAFDMDGTLLNSEKKISGATLEMIRKASDAGKMVVLSTGRCLQELEEYMDQIPGLRYMICVSGAMIYDVRDRKVLHEDRIPAELVEKILERSRNEDVMVHILSDESLVQCDREAHMDRYGMGIYQEMFDQAAKPVEDLEAYYRAHPVPAHKVNTYHTSSENRKKLRARLEDTGLVMADSETTSLECSAPGVTKGKGLEVLCRHLGISMEETIAVGDADNDMDVLRRAGLAVAMGNAMPSVKEICDVVVNDCDHDGCAEAIEKYLL